MRIYSPEITGSLIVSGSIIPGSSGSYDLGSVTHPFRDLYVTQNSIKFIDTNTREEISRISVNRSTGEIKLLRTKGKTLEEKASITGDTATFDTISPFTASAILVSQSITPGHTQTTLGHSDARFHTLYVQHLNFSGEFTGTGSLEVSGSLSNGEDYKGIYQLLKFDEGFDGNPSGNEILISLDSDYLKNYLNSQTVISSSAQITSLPSVDTDDLSEGSTNLYYTDSRVKTKLNTESVISGSVQVNHDSTTGFVSNEHIDHSQVTLTAGNGLTGGGDITTGRSFAVGQGDGISVGSDDVAVDSTVVRTSGTQTIAGNKTFSNNITIQGDLQVTGTTTTVNSTTVSIADNIIEINGTGAANGGILVKDITSPGTVSGSLLWDGTNNHWKLGTLGSENRVLTVADEGSGNGLDADTLDGQEGSYYRNASNINAGTINDAYLPGTISSDITGNSATATALATARTIGGVSFDGTANINLPGVNTAGNQNTSGNAATATKWATARTITLGGDLTGNVSIDGSANVTLTAAVANDSHTHDGRYFTETEADARFIIKNTGYEWTGTGGSALSFRSSDALETSSDGASLEIYQDTAGADAFMQFHVAGDYAVNFGLKGDINDLAVGGWSMGNNYYRMWHSGNDGSGSGLDADLLDGLQLHTGRNNEANKVVRTDVNGYIQAGWINTTSGDNGTTAIDRVYASSDGYIRYYTPTNFRSVLNVPTRTGGDASGTWGISINGNAATVSSITSNTGLMVNRLTPSSVIDSLSTTNFRSTLFGTTTNDAALSTARWNSTPSPLSGLTSYGTMIAWGASDTQGFLAVNYNTSGAIIGGGNRNNINWTSTLLTNNNYNSYSPTLTGGNASGTWGINITGDAGSVDGIDGSNILNKQSTSYYNLNTWLQSSGTHLLYSPSSGAGTHFYPGDLGDYGSFRTTGRKNSWGGYSIEGRVVFMHNGGNNFGLYDDVNNKWSFYSTLNGATDIRYAGTAQLSAENGYGLAPNQMRAPIFYDTDTGYYVDPNSTSNIYRLQANDKYHYFGASANWDEVGTSKQTNVHFQGHPQFWIGAGNGTWFTGTANTKSQASGLAADVSAHDLLITTMQSTSIYDRGITFAVDNAGTGNSGWRLGKWHSGDARDSSKFVVDGQIFAKAGYTDEYDYYADDYSTYYSSQGGNAHWAGDTNAGWHVPGVVASSAIQIQSGNGGVNSRKPQIQFHQYGYGGPAIEFDGPNKTMTFGELGTSNQDRINTFTFRFDNANIVTINGDYLTHTSDIRTPIFYDSNDTGYRVDPASTSIVNTVDLEGTIRHNGDTNTYMQFHAADQWRVVTGGSERLEVNNTATTGGRVDATSQMRSPIYYDRNNTAYYIHGDSTSYLYALEAALRIGIRKTPDTPFNIKQSADSEVGAIRLENNGSTDHWSIFSGTGNTVGLGFAYNSTRLGYLSTSVNVAQIDFTGQHRSLVSKTNDNITGKSKEDLVGLIVVADGTYTNLSGGTAPEINEALPNVSLSEKAFDKRAYGVISDREDLTDSNRTYEQGSFVTVFPTSGSEPERLVINSLGEGGMWVCDFSGSLSNGDYITSSPIKGLGMRQESDILHNYTVAKITQDCDFSISGSYVEFEWSGSLYRKQFVGVTYHCG